MIIAGDPWNILKCIVTVDPLYLGSWVRWAGVGDGHGFGWCYQLLSCRGPLWKLVKKSFQVCPISSYICGPWIEMDSVPAFRMNLGGLSRFYMFLPFVVSHCFCNWYDFDGSGVPFFLMEHNGAMLLMRSEQPGDLGCSQNALARCPQSISILYYII
jgi:hypothetical protein